MRADMDIIAMYNYDHSIFDGFVIPAQLDKNTLVNNLLMEGAERELLYSNFDFLKNAIGFWSDKMLHVWEEQYATTQYEYNPIWNKDGVIRETIERDLTGTEAVDDDLTRTNNVHTTNDVTNTQSVYGFNSSSDAPADKSVIDQDGSVTGTVTDNRDVDRTTTDSGTITTERIEQGNIGITTTQAMIQEQRSVVTYNMYDIIIHDFIDRFCLKVY